MRILIIILFITPSIINAIVWNFKYSGFSETKTINFNSDIEAINFSN